MSKQLIESLKTIFKNHRVENYGDVNYLFFNFDEKNLCLKYSNDYQINTLINQSDNGQYCEDIKVNWSNENEFLGKKSNSLLLNELQSELSVDEFLILIN
ncbi:MAG: hypothetical protein RBQ97_12000 [Acholeplasma sp.]|nr:hypothetical protein [Acholeplasma sp.]